MKLLITGGAGFIGSTLIRFLFEANQVATDSLVNSNTHTVNSIDSDVLDAVQSLHITNVDKLLLHPNQVSCNGIDQNAKLYTFEYLDITNKDKLRSVFSSFNPDAIIHLAAETHVDKSILYPEEFINTNVLGTLNLLELSLEQWQRRDRPENFRFLHVSTDEVFGSLGPIGSFTEDSCYAPRNPYSCSKAASDHLVSTWYETYGLPVIISNCSNNFGPYQFPDKLIPKTIVRALDNHTIPIYGSGLQIRDWINVRDHVEALMTILLRGRIGQSYNVGAENELTNLMVVERICTIIDDIRVSNSPHSKLITHINDRLGHDTRYSINPSRVNNEIGWYPRISFQDGLISTVEWYLRNESWWRQFVK